MRGQDLIKVIEDRLEAEGGKKPSSQDVCDHLGLTPYLLKQYRGYEALTPKQAAFAKLIRSIQLQGDRHVREIAIDEANGDLTRIVFSAQASDPAQLSADEQQRFR